MAGEMTGRHLDSSPTLEHSRPASINSPGSKMMGCTHVPVLVSVIVVFCHSAQFLCILLLPQTALLRGVLPFTAYAGLM